MLETLISSRIRRTLFEHLLVHPTEPFYLRGLAKTLGVSVSPLRRELARLERAGMLSAVQEGNMRFYRVNTASADFLQLARAGQAVAAPPADAAPQPSPIRTVVGEPPAPTPNSLVWGPAPAVPVGVLSAQSLPPAPAVRQGRFFSPLKTPALVGATVVGLALVGIVASLLYLTVTNDRLVAAIRRSLTKPPATVTVMTPPAASGVMRGNRWQVIPGGFGGFNSGSGDESY